MNKLLSLAAPNNVHLNNSVSYLLKVELAEHGSVSGFDNHILISISRNDFEQRLGNLLQQIYRTVDQHFPVRTQQMTVVIRDYEKKYENTFKIWPTK